MLVTRRQYRDDEITALFGASEEGMIRRVVPERWQDGPQAYLAEYERLHDGQARVFPGIREALQQLQGRGLRLAVVTGKGRGSAEITLRRRHLASYFDRVEAGSPEGPIKPSGIRAILDTWQMPPAACAYVGDTPYDMVAAAEAGVIGLAAAWAPAATVRENGEPPPAAYFRRVSDLVAWVERGDSLTA